jgi:hypothetical protein
MWNLFSFFQTKSQEQTDPKREREIKARESFREQSNKHQMDKISVSEEQECWHMSCFFLPCPCTTLEDTLEDLDIAGDPERTLVAEPELLLEQLRKSLVV